MIFRYKTLETDGTTKEGSIEAVTADIAINSLQRRGLIVTSIKSIEESTSFFKKNLSFLSRVSNKDVVILSRQISILFEAQVSALRVFRLLAAENESVQLRLILTTVADDLQGGNSISTSLGKHSDVFSVFYVNMVKAGEESGKLSETFIYLADYLERSYEVTAKARNALIYPAFIVATFITVMILMFTLVIPKIAGILTDSGQEIPIYTKIILWMSSFLVHYGIFALIILIIASALFFRYVRTEEGKAWFDRFKLALPYIGDLYRKLFLSRIADNMNTMIIAGIPMLRTLEITSSVVSNVVYRDILQQSIESVKAGSAVSDVFGRYKDIPGIMIQMIKVGEETGELGKILKTMARFYQREVMNSVDTLVDLIEPIMIVMLGAGVGILLAAVLVPIYNVASAF